MKAYSVYYVDYRPSKAVVIAKDFEQAMQIASINGKISSLILESDIVLFPVEEPVAA